MINIKDANDVQIWCDYQEETQQTNASFFLRLRFSNFRVFSLDSKDYTIYYLEDDDDAIWGDGYGNGRGDGSGYGYGYALINGNGWGGVADCHTQEKDWIEENSVEW